MLFQASVVYQANLNSVADVVVNQGGTDSSKTYSIIQTLYTIATCTEAPKSDPLISILSESIPNSRKGAYRVAKSIYADNEFLHQNVTHWNEGDRIITFRTGWQMEFLGVTDEQNAKQGKRQYLFVNEANGIPWLIFWQYAKRTRIRTFIDYNPSAPFWAHEKLIGTLPASNDLHAKVQLIISDHRHNPFLSEADHNKTENIKDPNLWRVYARGLTGNLSGLIYPNWKQIADADFPWKEDGAFGGIDFGYTNDPTACVKMVRIANKIYIHELCYEPGLSPQRLCALLKANGFGKEKNPIYCEHDGDMIRQLRMLNMFAVSARKGPNSINPGIHKVNEYEVYFTASSKNIAYERSRYMWMKDPDTGKSTNTPVDLDNHLMDAVRYGIYSHFYRQA